MKLNEYKCHPLVGGHRYKALWTNFDDHVFVLCKKVCRKLAALSRISNYMSFEKKQNSFKKICRITVWVLPIDLDVL